MIDRKYQHIVFALLMSLLMSCIMSFVISVFNVGLVHNIAAIWLKAWLFAFLIAFPTIMLVVPVVRYLVERLLRPLENNAP